MVLEGNAFFVDALVDGKPARLLVDTTAPRSALALGDGEHVVVLGGVTVGTKWAVDPSLAAKGVAGVLSPQSLQPDGAVVLDFPRRRLVSLGGKLNTWLRWLDERAQQSVVESLPRAGPRDGALYVKARPGDGRDAVARLDTTATATAFSTALFEPQLLAGRTKLEGVHVRLGESEFGPLNIDVAAMEGREGTLGLDLLGRVVLLLPCAGNQPLWVMTPRE